MVTSVLDIEPGLYRHYKKGDLYRVLFFARYIEEESLVSDEDVVVFVDPVSAGFASTVHLHLVAGREKNFERGMYLDVLKAKNSTDGPTSENCVLVVYVALYGYGRVSVRELGEFAAKADEVLNISRFTRVGE